MTLPESIVYLLATSGHGRPPFALESSQGIREEGMTTLSRQLSLHSQFGRPASPSRRNGWDNGEEKSLRARELIAFDY